MRGEAVDAPRQAEPANYFSNGNFEVGLPTSEWCTPYASYSSLRPEYLIGSGGSDGGAYLCMPLYQHYEGKPITLELMHRVMKLQPNTTYYFRGMFKAAAPMEMGLHAETAYGKQTTFGRQKATLGSTWQEVKYSFKTPSDIRGCYFVINASAKEPAKLLIDELSLSSAPREAFTPSAGVEVGLTWKPVGKVFYADQPVEFSVRTRKYDPAAKAEIRCRVINYFDQQVFEKTLSADLAGSAVQTQTLQLPNDATGSFRLLVDGVVTATAGRYDLPIQEYVYCVVPQPPAKMLGTLGAYTSIVPDAIETMSRAGIRRTTTDRKSVV